MIAKDTYHLQVKGKSQKNVRQQISLTKDAEMSLGNSGDYGSVGAFECFLYKYPCGKEKPLTAMLTHEHKPLHWIVRGLALLAPSGGKSTKTI